MSEEMAENGTAKGDVPEIELIIKVGSALYTFKLLRRLGRIPCTVSI